VIAAFKNMMRRGEHIVERDDGEILVLFEVGREAHSVIGQRLKHIVKETCWNKHDKNHLDFSWAWAVFPKDGACAQDLLAHTENNFVSEKEERLKSRIMIVDDEPEIVRGTRKILQNYGYQEFLCASNGREALKAMEEKTPDLLIVDIRMPQMSGYELIGRIKENYKTKDIPVLIASAFQIDADQIDKYNKTKAIPVIEKPFLSEDLIEIVNYLL